MSVEPLSRVMALDVGDRRIGVAVSDPTRLLARSVRVVQRTKDGQDFREIAALAREHEVAELVVGYPRHLSGDVSDQARSVEAYVELLRAELEACGLALPISYWDERYSSVIASELVQERRRKKDRPQHIDAVAAAVILQGYLDAHRPDALSYPAEEDARESGGG